MCWKFEPFVSYFGIKLLKSFIPGLLSHHLLSIGAFQSWAWFHWEWRYDVILIKIRRHDRSHLRVDTWEEESRKVEKFNVSLFQISINLSSFVCLPVFFSCSWSSRLNLVVIVQCLVREHFSTNWTFQKLTNEEYRWEPRCEFDSITKKFLHLKPRSRGRRRLKEWKRKTSCEGLLIRRRRQELLFPASLPAALLLSQCCLKEW